VTVIAIDVGTVRVGVASTDASETIASPLVTLTRKREDRFWQRLGDEIAQRSVATVVVGLPKSLDGSEGDAARAARDFGTDLANRFNVLVEYWDERFTSVAAERALVEADVKRAKRREITDEVAACLLLQSWLEARAQRAASSGKPHGPA
jgi:putative Holliday junction resolvase